MILSEEEKKGTRPPFQITISMDRLGYSVSSHVLVCQILTNIYKTKGMDLCNRACLKGVELMESGATEAEVIEALSKL